MIGNSYLICCSIKLFVDEGKDDVDEGEDDDVDALSDVTDNGETVEDDVDASCILSFCWTSLNILH